MFYLKSSKIKIITFNSKLCYNRFNFYSSNVLSQIATGYKPKEVEKNKYPKWADEIYKSKKENNKPKFSMILPPPNVTGYLHLGHVFMCTIQDVICRRKNQQGFDVNWVPGTDHAGIATQTVVEKKILHEKKLNRHQLGRNKFLEEIWKWKKEKGTYILEDLKKIGCILNWNDEYFTMDEHLNKAVVEAFIRLFDENLIQRKTALVNWSCCLESTVSDIEIDTKEISGPTSISVPGHEKNVVFGQLYDIAYKISTSDEEIIVSTTRPETLLGDVAVAVHPEDERYKKFVNSSIKLWHPFRKTEIPLVFDKSVLREFGTGAVKVTPTHDKDDYAMAEKHNLSMEIEVFTKSGLIREEFEHFRDLPRFEARDRILNELANLQLLRGVKPHKMNLPICSRSNDVIEYILQPQWFLDCKEMASKVMEAVRTGQIRFHPTNFENDWYRWLGNIKDWCISRQLWWGHQIPAYLIKFDSEEHWIAARSELEAQQIALHKFGTHDFVIEKDRDVLDTWFSSSLLPFAIFNWPQEEYKSKYPLDLMETGHDILFFWVARMAMMGLKLTGEVPFRNVLLHGIVCDAHGRKMSKSLGNVITPDQVIYGASVDILKQEIEHSHVTGLLSKSELQKSLNALRKNFPNGIPECGTDALRFTLCSFNIKSHFINFEVSECLANKLFFNKIWQATRYTLAAFDKFNINPKSVNLEDIELTKMDRWILSRLAATRKICNQSFENYNFHLATTALRNFFYFNFCDIYLETTKLGISKNTEFAVAHCSVLAICLSLGLQTMAPITPFLSEELMQYFPKFSEIIDSSFLDESLEQEVAKVLEVCSAIRQFKSQNKITKKFEPKIYLFPQNQLSSELLRKYQNEIQTLTLSSNVFLEDINSKKKFKLELSSTAGHLCSFGITTNELYDSVKESNKVLNSKKLGKLQNDLEKLLKTISTDGYKKSAHENVQKKNLEKLKQIEIEINNMKGINF